MYFYRSSTMKKLLIKIIAALILLFLGIQHSDAQYSSNRFDGDINSLRNGTLQDFRLYYDDYLQYSPAGLMLAMKICGYESRSSWPRMLASGALSTAITATTVNVLKYSVKRPRPDGSKSNSFPSGHTATAFMTATMLHKEYGWRSPWFSIGGYTVATVTGVSRILNNKHWMTDIAAGAAIGIGSVHLAYYLTDLLFKKKGVNSIYETPCFQYNPSVKHYVAELLFGHRHIIGYKGMKEMGTMPLRGGLFGLSTDIPIVPGIGAKARINANSLIWNNGNCSEMYSMLAGGFWNLHFARRFEFQTHVMAGYAWINSFGDESRSGADLAAGISLSLLLNNHFKIKAFADIESFNLSATAPWMNSVVLGWSSSWLW